MKHVFIQGPVGTGAGAKPALFPDSLTMFGLRCSFLDVQVVARQVNLIMQPFLAS